jgi:OmpA-OmpF porin, OOP family
MIASGLLAPVAALAGPFLGASIGQGEVDRDITEPLITSGSFDGKDTAFKIFSGYMFTPNVGIESAYVNFGKLNYAGQFGTQPVADGTVKPWGFNIAMLGAYSMTREFSLLGKLGALFWEWRAEDTTSGQPFATGERGADVSYGLGLAYSVSRRFSVRVEWERFKLDHADASLISLGAGWNF